MRAIINFASRFDHSSLTLLSVARVVGERCRRPVQLSIPIFELVKKDTRKFQRNELWSDGFFRALVVARECVNLQQSLIPPHRPSALFISKYLLNSRESLFDFYGQKSDNRDCSHTKSCRWWRHRACDCQFSSLTHPISFPAALVDVTTHFSC